MPNFFIFFIFLNFYYFFSVQAAVHTELSEIRKQVLNIEENLIQSLKEEGQAGEKIKNIRILIELQKKEKNIVLERKKNLQTLVDELGSRREKLKNKILKEKKNIYKFLVALKRSQSQHLDPASILETEKLENPRRKALSNLTQKSIQSLEILKVDVSDLAEVESKIEEEQSQLEFLINELKEQEGLLLFHRQLQADIVRKKYQDRLEQFQNYKKLKETENKVETLIGQVNARKELEVLNEKKLEASQESLKGEFVQKRGRLRLPLENAELISTFGRHFDSQSQLYVFKKGIELSAQKNDENIKSVFSGKVAFSGVLPGFKKVVIIDHGAQYYSLCGRLGEVFVQAGDWISEGQPLGQLDDAAKTLYFEIRKKNVPVNPLRWLANSFNLSKR